MSMRTRLMSYYDKICRLYEELSTLSINYGQRPATRYYGPIPYHEKRDELFCNIDNIYRELTPRQGQEFLKILCPHRNSEQLYLMDEAYRKTTPHEGKRLLAKMCPPNV